MDFGLRHGDATSLANAAWTQGQQRPSARSTRNGVGGHRHSRVAPIHKSTTALTVKKGKKNEHKGKKP